MLSKRKWTTPADQPDLNAAHEALLLKEQFVELLRTDEVRQKPIEYQRYLKRSELAAHDLELSLRKSAGEDTAESREALVRITQNCAACHQTYRDVPLTEKRD